MVGRTETVCVKIGDLVTNVDTKEEHLMTEEKSGVLRDRKMGFTYFTMYDRSGLFRIKTSRSQVRKV